MLIENGVEVHPAGGANDFVVLQVRQDPSAGT